MADHIYLVANLVQDVAHLRPLAFLAARETGAKIGFLISEAFARRDPTGLWQDEIRQIAAQTGATTAVFGTPAESYALLQGRRGILIAASESNLRAHAATHNLFRLAPPGFLKVTLQHGLECVGFLQTREHTLTYGRGVTFAADVLCAWMPPDTLSALAASQRGKVLVTGPASVLQRPVPPADAATDPGGLICENLHSIRLKATGDHARPFIDTFNAFCRVIAAAGERATLRPHPGGQYVIRNQIELPPNVALNNLPVYRAGLSAHAYGISAPSTILLDMVLADIPVAVWQDEAGLMDTVTYAGLTMVSTLPDWIAFHRDARLRPASLLARQRAWLDGLALQVDPAVAYRRFARLLVNGTAYRDPAPPWHAAPVAAGGAA